MRSESHFSYFTVGLDRLYKIRKKYRGVPNEIKQNSYCISANIKIFFLVQYSNDIWKNHILTVLITLLKKKYLLLYNKKVIAWILVNIVPSSISYCASNHIPPPRKHRGFSRQSYRSLIGKRQRHSERITCRRPLQWMWFLNVWDNVPVDLKYACQQYFTYMCFLGFIRYKTLIARGFRKYEILFTHEYHISLTSMQ